MVNENKIRLVALIEENYNSQTDKDFRVINFLPDIKVKKVIEDSVHKQDENRKYCFEIEKKDVFQIPYTKNIKDLSVIVGTNGSGKTTIINKIFRENNRENIIHLIFERDGSLYTYPNFKQESMSFKQSNIHPYIIKFSNAREFLSSDESIRSGAIDASNFKTLLLFNKGVLKISKEKIISLLGTINQIKFIEEYKYKINQFVDYSTKGVTVNFQSSKLSYNINQLAFVDMVSSMKKNDAEKGTINVRIVDYFSVLINHIIDNYSTDMQTKDIEKLLDYHLSVWNDNFEKQNDQDLQRALSEIIKYPYNTYSIYDIKILYSLFIFHIYSYYIKNNNGQHNKYKNKLASIIKENRTIYGNYFNKREINEKLLNQYFKSVEAINYLDVSLSNIESITPNAKYFTKWRKIWSQIEKKCITVAKGLIYISYFNLHNCGNSIKYKLDNQKVWQDLLYFGVSDEDINQLSYFGEILSHLEENTKNFESLTSVINCVSKIKIPEVIESIQMNWNGLSSGELGLLESFANLYMAKTVIEKITGQGVQRKNILLLLDEVDLGLHPEWQRKWISTALPIIEKIFDDKHLQVIITTHSPIFLSDIYKENIIFLTTDNNEELNEKTIEKTFGQNIYTLFKNSFFLNDVIGEYAFNTIKYTIEYLRFKINSNSSYNRSESLYNNSDEIINEKTAKKVIDSIGEPIIANQLKELFYRAFPDKNAKRTEIENRIAQLQKKLEELEEEHSQ